MLNTDYDSFAIDNDHDAHYVKGYINTQAEISEYEKMLHYPALLTFDEKKTLPARIQSLAQLSDDYSATINPERIMTVKESAKIIGLKRALVKLNTRIQALPESEREKFDVHVNHSEELQPPKPGHIVSEAQIKLWQREARSVDKADFRINSDRWDGSIDTWM